MSATRSDVLERLISTPQLGEIFSRAWQVWIKGNVAAVRGNIGVIRAYRNVSTPQGIERQLTYWPDPTGPGCCLLGSAMLGLEVRHQRRREGVLEVLSWLSFITNAQKSGLLHGFDGLPEDESYDLTGQHRVKVALFHDEAAYRFGQEARIFVESALGGIPWVGAGPDPLAA